MEITSKDINSYLSEIESLSIKEKLSLVVSFIDEQYGQVSIETCEKILNSSSKLFSLVQSFLEVNGEHELKKTGNLDRILDAYYYITGAQEYTEFSIESNDNFDESSEYEGNDEYNPIKLYLKDLNYPVLTFEQEQELAYKIKNGDMEARDTFIKHNLRLVASIVKRFIVSKGSQVPFLDLVEEGNFGLIRAVDKYDPSLGHKFSTYATYHILQAVTIAANTQSNDDIIFPRYFYDAYNKYKQLIVLVTHVLGREATDKELANLLDVSVLEIEKFKTLKYEYVSLNKEIDKDDTPLIDIIPDSSQMDMYDISENNYLKEEVMRIIKTLPKRDFDIIYEFFYNEKTLEQIAAVHNLSYQRVQKIVSRLMIKLREKKSIQKLQVYVTDNLKEEKDEKYDLRFYKQRTGKNNKKKTDDLIISKIYEKMRIVCNDLQNNKYTYNDIAIIDKVKKNIKSNS